jgi:hypothetical protein
MRIQQMDPSFSLRTRLDKGSAKAKSQFSKFARVFRICGRSVRNDEATLAIHDALDGENRRSAESRR